MTRLEPFTEAVLPYMPYLIPLPVLLPALAAAGCLLFPRMLNVRRAFVFFTLLALAVLSATMASKPCRSAVGTPHSVSRWWPIACRR